jgi:outer membrane protein assembly factor BamB
VDDVGRLTELWSIDVGGVASTPVAGGGLVFVAVYAANSGGDSHLYALDAATGEVRWSLSFAGAGCRPNICVSPSLSVAVSDGVVYVGEVLTTSGGLTAYDAQTGAPIRSYSAASVAWPVVADGKVYASYYNGDFGIAAWDVATGDPVFRTTGAGFGFPELAVSGGRVYVARDGTISVYDADGEANCTGGPPRLCSPLWTIPVPNAPGIPAVDGNRLFLGPRVFDANGCGAATCPQLWTAQVNGFPELPAIADGVLYVPAGDSLGAFPTAGCGAATCPPLWTAPLPQAGPVSVANGVVYALSSRTEIRAFAADGCNADSCTALATVPTSADITGSISISHGQLLIATADHRVHALGLTPDSL